MSLEKFAIKSIMTFLVFLAGSLRRALASLELELRSNRMLFEKTSDLTSFDSFYSFKSIFFYLFHAFAIVLLRQKNVTLSYL